VSDFSASETPADCNLTSIVGVIDDPVRSAMLAALAGGQALPAGELARRAGVQPRAASVHLRPLKRRSDPSLGPQPSANSTTATTS
jgi:hypothetical protein